MKKIIVVVACLLATGCTYSLQQACYSDKAEQRAETPKTVSPTTDVSVPASVVP